MCVSAHSKARLDREFHHLQRGAAHDAVGIAERLLHFIVIIAFANDELDGLTRGLQRGIEVARLALELRRLQRTMRESDRRADLIDVALRAQRLLHGVGDLDVVSTLGKSHRLQIVHAAAEERGFYDSRRQAVLRPVAEQDAAAEMRAGRMAAEIDLLRIAAETRSIAVDPGDG